jgi:hypothetical protein|tara:strand:+ start:316 stop:786 length:471 start_codon:yes stop_codon:yes gene_type:complete
MAIFSGKIIEAYFANSENDAVEVIYKDGNRAINHYLSVDFNNQDFKDLIKEYNTDKIAEATIARNRRYAQQLSDIVDAGIKSKTDTKQRISIEDIVRKILMFDADDKECQEILFTLKIEIFETKKLKDCVDKEYKNRLRSAKTPIELMSIYNELND